MGGCGGRVVVFALWHLSFKERGPLCSKEDPEGYKIWRLEQLINYGEPGEKIEEKMVRKYWKKIKNRIDPLYREFLELLLWPKKKKVF